MVNVRDADGNTPLHLAVQKRLEQEQRELQYKQTIVSCEHS